MKVARILGIILGAVLVVLGSYKIISTKVQVKEEKSINLMEYGKYKEIKEDNIDYIEVTKYTVAGGDTKKITNEAEIKATYNSLNSIKLEKKTDMACEDNTTVYGFVLKNGKRLAVEIECDWVIIGKDRYLID